MLLAGDVDVIPGVSHARCMASCLALFIPTAIFAALRLVWEQSATIFIHTGT